MVKTEPQIELGKSLIELLDQKKQEITAFLWFYLPEANSWRLVISGKSYENKDIRECYESFIQNFGKESIVQEIGLPNITIVSNSDNLLNLLKAAVRTGSSISGIRFTSCVVNNVLIEDAYIYRLV